MQRMRSTPRKPGHVSLHEPRLERLRGVLRERRLDAVLITNPNDILYLTGFSGESSAAVATARRFVLISDFRFREELEPLRRSADVIIRKGAMAAAQAALVKRLRPRTLAVQAEYLPAASRDELAKSLRGTRLRNTIGMIAGLRSVKDESEIEAIARAVAVQEAALLATLRSVRPGRTERDIAARLEFEMRSRGADAPSFPAIVAAGSNGSLPHHRAGDARIARGGTLLIDWGARVAGYCADMTRTFALGRWPRRMKDVYRVVLEAHLAGIDAVRPGRACADVDRAARRVIERAGYGKAFGHGLGHGIGLDVHENPRIFRTVAAPLEPGMVITIEPGIYLPGVGGVRIEDGIVVTSKGARCLCSLPKDIQWATLHG